MSNSKWYQDGLKFSCTGCSECCRTHGEYAFVYLSSQNVKEIANYLQMSTIDFLNAHCKSDPEGWIHLSMTTGDCNFLNDAGRCDIYPVRPKQCDAWPFWTENLVEETWEGSVKACCPGIDKGKRYTKNEIEQIAKDRDSWYEE